jgi:hypothetical protein
MGTLKSMPSIGTVTTVLRARRTAAESGRIKDIN